MERFEAATITHLLVVSDPTASRDWYVRVLEASVYSEYASSVVSRSRAAGPSSRQAESLRRTNPP